MRLSEIERKATDMGIKDTWKYSKKELIKTIQRNEGNNACFATGIKQCPQSMCSWRSDCQK